MIIQSRTANSEQHRKGHIFKTTYMNSKLTLGISACCFTLRSMSEAETRCAPEVIRCVNLKKESL